MLHHSIFLVRRNRVMKSVYDAEENCCGCSACYSICPRQAIAMEEDSKGFRYPIIDNSKCVGCGLCKRVCRFPLNKENLGDIQRFFAIKHKDKKVVRSSQSGGAFTLFSDWILEQNGVIYGAKLNTSDFSVSHVRADSAGQRDLMRGSKYVQSDMHGCFDLVASDLLNGRFVLFSGTPCQCDGLLSFLDLKHINVDRLYTADIICHGVPSQKMFKSFVKWNEKRYGITVSNFLFREKYKYPWGKHIEKIVFENGKTVYSEWFANIFYNDCSLRGSCFNCHYAFPVRNTDLTYADFWGIGKCRPEMNDRYGCSALIVHSEKGLDLLEKLRYNAIITEVCKCDLVDPQPHLHGSVTVPKNYKQFWMDYKNLDFEEFLLRYSYNTVTITNTLKTNFKLLAKFPFRVLRKFFGFLKTIH